MVNFDNCRVPVENRVGAEGEGFRFAMMGLGRRAAEHRFLFKLLGGAIAFALELAKVHLEIYAATSSLASR